MFNGTVFVLTTLRPENPEKKKKSLNWKLFK